MMSAVESPTVNRSIDQPVWFAHIPVKKTHPSEYITKYTRHSLAPVQDSREQRSILTRTTPHETVGPSEARDQYTTLEPADIRHCRRRDQIQLSQQKLDSNTTYAHDFPFNQVGRQKPTQPPPATITLVDGTHVNPYDASIYRKDFRKFARQEITQPIPIIQSQPTVMESPPQPNSPIGKSISFNDSKTQEKNQSALSSPKMSKFEPERSLRGGTEYSGNYHMWDTVRCKGVTPVYKRPKEPFVGSSSYNDTFKAVPIVRTLPVDQSKGQLKMEGDFYGETLYKASFVTKPLIPPTCRVFTNNDSVMYSTGDKDWWNHVPTDPFLENRSQIFYKAP